ncbi:MAG: hypothetical protein ACOVP7_05720 [Lacibacter sp.]
MQEPLCGALDKHAFSSGCNDTNIYPMGKQIKENGIAVNDQKILLWNG